MFVSQKISDVANKHIKIAPKRQNAGYYIVWDRKHLTNEGNLDYLKKQNKQALKIIKTSILENLEHTKTNPLTFEKKS